MNGRLVSVNVSRSATVSFGGATYATGINKIPVSGEVALRGVNLAGDDQADRQAHGGPDRALYAYAADDYAWWSTQLGRELAPGAFGDNLTVAGIDANAVIGERWKIGERVVLEVTSPRVPCFKLQNKIGAPHFIKDFARALRPGAYLRVITEGCVATGDTIEIVHRPVHGITVADVARVYFFERDKIATLRPASQLGAGWLDWIEKNVN